jgi:N12 class adenine-specific DNA methylase
MSQPRAKMTQRPSTLDDLIASGLRYQPLEDPAASQPEQQPSGVMRRVLGDGAVSLLKGAVGVPEAAVGLADLATGGRVGRALEQGVDIGGVNIGFRPRMAKEALDQMLTPEQQQANREVQEAEGFLATTMAAVRNPSTVLHAVGESLPVMGGGAVLGRALMAGTMAAAPGLAGRVAAGGAAPLVASQSAQRAAGYAPILAGAAGEGLMTMGSQAESIRQESADGLLTGQQSAIAAGSGALTGVLGVLGGAVARKLGITDIDTLLQGKYTPEVTKGFARRVLEGAVAEGLMEELPQSVQEQVAQNLALGKPLGEGVPQAAVLGALSGGLMGAGGNALTRPRATMTAGDAIRQEKQPEAGPVAKAANAGLEQAAQQADALQPAPPVPAVVTAPPVMAEPAAPVPQVDPNAGAFEQRMADQPQPPTAEPLPGERVLTNMDNAMRAQARAGDGAEIVPVAGGVVVRKVDQDTGEMVPASTSTAGDTQQAPVVDAQEPDPEDLPPSIRNMPKAQRDLLKVDEAIQNAKTATLANVISDEAGNRSDGELSYTPERAVAQVLAAADGAKDQDGKLRSGNRTGATSSSVLRNWVLQRTAQNSIDASRKANPDLWAAYDARQAQVAGLKVGDKVHTPYPSPEQPLGSVGVVSRKFAKNWRIAYQDGTTVNVPPQTLRPFVAPQAPAMEAADAPVQPTGTDEKTASPATPPAEAPAPATADAPAPASVPGTAAPAAAEAAGVGGRWNATLPKDREPVLLRAGWKTGSPGLQSMAGKQWADLNPNQRARVTKAMDDAPAAPAAPAPATKPAPLYASRPLMPASAEAIRAWAASQGFKSTLPAADMHVTVAYSREPVDGAAVPDDAGNLVVPTGKRTVEPLGDKGAVVLKFASPALQARWKQYRDAGASWDYESYNPHVTITYEGAGVDLAKVQPFTGTIELAAETQEPLNVDKADDYKAAGEVAAPKATDQRPAGKRRMDKATESRLAAAEAKRAAYFTPGNVVKSYGGHDEVLQYFPINDAAQWGVRVRAVVKDGDTWVVAKEGGRDAPARNHSTQPGAENLAAGPVGRMAQAPAPAPAPKTDKAEIRPFRRADGSIGYEAVPIAPPAAAPASAKESAPEMPVSETDKGKPAPSANTIFTEDAAAAARARLKAKLGRTQSGIDPETLMDGITLAGYHIERGARRFAAFARAMVDDLGDGVKPWLQSWYMAVRSDPRAAGFKGDMDKASAVEDLDVDQVLAETAPAQPPTAELGGAAEPAAEENATQETANVSTEVPSDGPQALGAMAAAEGGGTEGRGATGSSPASGGEAGPGAGGGPDGAAVPATRGRRGGAVGVRPAAAGTRRRRGNVGDGRTGDAGARVPADDAQQGLDLSPEAASPPNIPAQNFRITPELRLGRGGEVEKFNDNLAAVRTLKQIEQENRRATPAEQAILARYVGWGGLANAFPAPLTGEFKPQWKDRGEALRELLTPSEYAAARRSTRNAHYTSETVVSAMWSAARRLGYRGGLTLESSMGPGNFLGLSPEGVPAKFIGIEYDGLTARIATHLYPQAAVLHSGFQKVPLANGAFTLNIGNPPFGSESLRFQYKPELTGVSIHNQFFRAGLNAVRPGGLQIKVVSRFLMDAQDKASRLALARKGRLVAAIRLPDTAFKENARTEAVTDIVILQRYTPEEEARANAIVDAYLQPKQKDPGAERERWLLADQIPEWVETVQVKDPLGGDPMVVNSYFRSNPKQVLGVMERSGSMQHGADITVRLDDPKALEGMLADAVGRLPEGISNIDDEVLATTEARFKMLGDALRIAVANEEPGHMKFDEDGKLSRVIDREYPDGGDVMARQTITPDSPWSESLSMDAEGRWYKLEVQTGPDGKPLKVMKGDKPTNRNVYDRTVYATEADVPVGLRLGQAGYDRLAGLVGLRDLLKRQLVLETDDAPARMMEDNRKRLAEAYEAFAAKFGPVNRKGNLSLAMTMPDGGLVAALEVGYDPERTAEQAKKSGLPAQSERVEAAPILRERVVLKHEAATTATNAADALVITLAERGRVDMDRIAELLGISPEAAAAELQAGETPLVFMDPESNTWETADAYLSGLVRRKLVAAKAAGVDINVKALEKVQPEAWTAENVTAQIGATWVPPDVYAGFAEHLLGGKAHVSFSSTTNSYSLSTTDRVAGKAEQWEVDGAPATYILTRLLNSQAVVVTYVDADKVTRIDQEKTSLAILKAKEIVNEFGDWVFKDGERRARLVSIFNEKFNTRVSRQFDGQHLTLPGKVPDSVIAMRRHQKNAIWRGISSRFLLLDHVVGSGKTFTGIARAMERRRMGLARKPAIMVPNHLVEQWAADVYRLYPGAKVLAAGQKDFDPKRRRRLFGKIATGDWDIVIVPHSSFGFIGIAPETEQRFLEAEMREAEAAIKEAWEQAEEDGQAGGRGKPFGVKEAERLADKIQQRMDKIASGTRDRLLTFEQLGIDDLTVDEAHEFKNLYYSSRLTGVRGMGNKTGSRKAADLYNKVRVLRESGGAVTFMTGTPVSNSAVELYTMMRYLAADELADQGLTHFDAWRTQYVEATPAFEPTESGRLKEVTRLGRTWSNMRSLMESYYQFTDAVSNDDIKRWYAEDNNGAKFPVPPVKGGERQLVKMAPTPAQDALLKQTMADFDALPDIKDTYERNKARLRLMDRARKLSLDIRAVDARSNSDEKNGKLEVLSRNVKRIYDQWNDDKGTQVVFLDRSVPKAKGDDKIIKEYDELVARRDAAAADGDDAAFQDANDALEKFDGNEIAELRSAQGGGWNAYQQIKDNLVALGIPANEIRFMQEATNDEQKQAMFDAVNGGKVRVLIGSTPRMGAGTNVQQRLVGLHHADVTWKPSDIEQREGRIIRQGNLFATPPTADRPNPMYRADFEAEILAYATERTVDAKMWDLNATKLRTINGLRNYDGAFTMDIEDEESVSMAEMAALASGNPLLLERVKLESQINTLELLQKVHQRKGWGALDAVERARAIIEDNPAKIERSKARAAQFVKLEEAEAARTTGRTVTVEGKEFSSLPEAFAAAKAAVEAQQDGKESARYAITIDGKRVTSKDAIGDAIGAALGDAQPFLIEFGGKKYTQRTVAGRESAPLINKAMTEVQASKGDVAVDLGRMYGLRVVADLTPSRWRKGFVSLDITLLDGDSTISTVHSQDLDPGMQVGTPLMRDLLGNLYGSVKDGASSDSAWYMESQLANAKRDLPELEAKLKETAVWPKAGELAEKRARLTEVATQLSSAGPAATDTEPDGASTNRAQTGAPEANETDVLYSRGAAGGTKTQSLRAALEAEFSPETISTLERAGLLAIANRPSLGMPADAAGATQAGGISLFAANTAPGSVAVAYHEALHATLRQTIGDDAFGILMARLGKIERMAQKGGDVSRFFVRAAGRIPAETRGQDRLEELAAYAVEAYQADRESLPAGIMRWVADLLAALRAGLVRAMRAAKIPHSITVRVLADPATLHRLARDGLQAMARQGMGQGMAPAFSQQAAGPKWFSSLDRAIEGLSMGAAPAQGWRDSIKGLVAKGAVKADEVEWTGLNEWLDMQQGKVPKAAVLEFLQANGVQVTETVLEDGGMSDLPPGWQLRQTLQEDDTEAAWVLVDEDNEVRGEGETSAEAMADGWDADAKTENPTKYANYTLPGGTNYREVLLMLPDGRKPAPAQMERPKVVDRGPNEYGRGQFDVVSDGEVLETHQTWSAAQDHALRVEQEENISRNIAWQKSQPATYKSGHWDQPNILAHIRVNDRTDADGKRVLFVEEIQSDWAQQGKKDGFADGGSPEAGMKTIYRVVGRNGQQYIAPDSRELAQAYIDGYDERTRAFLSIEPMEVRRAPPKPGIPRAPFVGKTDAWVALALKRVVKMAVDGGYDRVAFVTGEQSADRYDLSKQIDRIDAMQRKSINGLWDVDIATSRGQDIRRDGLTASELEDLVGKEMAQRIIDATTEPGKRARFSGLDLKVGGEGMKAFYDKIVPTVAKDVLRKVGGGVLETVTMTPQYGNRWKATAFDGSVRFFSTNEAAHDWLDRVHDSNGGVEGEQTQLTQPGFTITEAMRTKAAGGMPMFSRTLGTALTEGLNNVRDVRLPANYVVGDLFQEHGKVHWWHKTVGTQHNLAEREPLFKRVYDSVQSFIGDVSHYATEAANLAPNILPKLEKWRDIVKRPIAVEDSKAIAAPIFEGTLTWMRGTDGQPVRLKQAETEAEGMSSDEKARSMMLAGKLDERVFKMWQGMPIDQFDAAVETRFKNEMLRPGVVWKDSELRAMFNLNSKQIDLYKEFRRTIDKSLNDMAVTELLRYGGDDVLAVRQKALGNGDLAAVSTMLAEHLWEAADMQPDRADVLNDTARRIQEKADHVRDLMKRGYAPLSRFGQYTLDIVDADGERVYFGLFETTRERARMERQLLAQLEGAKSAKGTTSLQAYRQFAGVSPETLELFGEFMGLESSGSDEASKAFQQYIKLTKSTRSAMRRLIERKGIQGYSEDVGRVLAGFVYSNARQASSNLHMGEMSHAAAEIPHGPGQMQDRALELVEYVKNPQEEAQVLRGWLFAQYLGGSVASALVNMTQPATVTLPYLSQYGGAGKAAKQIAAAAKLANKADTGDKALNEALRKAEEDGTVSPQEVHQLQAQAMGNSSFRVGDGTTTGDLAAKAMNKLSIVSFAWGKLFGMAEQVNRRITFIAAYRTAIEQGNQNPEEFARKAVNETQFVYNKGNKPRWARGAIGSVAFTFKQYSISYLELMNRMWNAGDDATEAGRAERKAGRKAVLLALAVLMLAGGADGLPFMQDVEDIVDGLLQRLGYNFSTKQARREFLVGVLGDGGADFVAKGLSGLPGAPIDVSGRMGMGNLIPATGLFTKKTDYSRDVAEIAGPVADLASRALKSVGQVVDGDPLAAAATMSPVAARNLLKGIDMAATGMYRDDRGRKVIDTDGYDAAMKAIGFQPRDVARVQESVFQVQRSISQTKIREGEIAQAWAQGMFEKDPAKIQEARDELARWNKANPEARIVITMPQILKRVRAMNMPKAERIAQTAPKEMRAQVRQGLADALQ